MSASGIGGVNPPRLCLIRKRQDFAGYGFNLQAEKGKPGQFIGNVDAGSPAEISGVRRYDRVIEVNGVNVCNETHKQVVARIKEITDEVTLLLMDPESERKYLENGIVIKSDMDIIERHGISESYNVPNGSEEYVHHEPVAVPVENEEEVHATAVAVDETEKVEEVASESVEEIKEPSADEIAVAEEVERATIEEPSESIAEIDDLQRESTQEEGLDESDEHGSASYEVAEVAAASDRLNEEAVDDAVEEDKVKEENQPELSVNGDALTSTVIVETTINHAPPSSEPVNGSAKPEPKYDSVFSMSAMEARASQGRSRRRAIKETNQTFKEKFMVFENL